MGGIWSMDQPSRLIIWAYILLWEERLLVAQYVGRLETVPGLAFELMAIWECVTKKKKPRQTMGESVENYTWS